MILRQANLQDLDAMVQIIQSCRELLSLESELNWNKKSLYQAITESFGQVLGAYQLEKLVGFILFKELFSTKSSIQEEQGAKGNPCKLLGLSAMNGEKSMNSCLEIWCLATLPTYQGKGVMGSLLKELKTKAEEIWLEVHELNTTAINFYKNQTFQQVGARPHYYKDGKNALLLTWKEEPKLEFNQ